MKRENPYRGTIKSRLVLPDFSADTYPDKIRADLRKAKTTTIWSKNVDPEIHLLLEVLLDRFIHSWYQSISKQAFFPAALEIMILKCLKSLITQLSSIDFLGLLVRKVIPIITQHLHEFVEAEKMAVKNGIVLSQITDPEAYHEEIVRRYQKGKLHNAVTFGTVNKGLQQSSLRQILGKVLPNIIPAAEARSHIVLTLITEIMSCAIIHPLLDTYTDPDALNTIISQISLASIEETARVRAFTQELENRVSLRSKRSAGTTSIIHSVRRRQTTSHKSLEKLVKEGSHKEWEKFYRRARRLDNVSELQRISHELEMLRQRNYHSQPSLKQQEIISQAHSPVKQNNLQSDVLRIDETPLIKAISIVEQRLGDLTGAFPSYKRTLMSSYNRKKEITLEMVMTAGVSYFIEFMERRGRAVLFDFWTSVTSLKMPVGSEKLTQLAILDSNIQLSQSDIKALNGRFFQSQSLIVITDEERTHLKNYVDNEPDNYDVDANETIIAIARRTWKIMEIEDFPHFQNDELCYKFVTSTDLFNVSETRSNITSAAAMIPLVSDGEGDVRSHDPLKATELYAPGYKSLHEAELVDQELVRSLDDALTDILVEGTLDLRATHPTGVSLEANGKSHTAHFRPLYRRKSSASCTPASGSLNSGNTSEVEDLHYAAPGDLSLPEEISRISSELDEKIAQDKVLESMLQKALSRGHDAQISVLRSSKREVQSDIRRLETQKQQYELQENEHDLYGRSSVTINSHYEMKDPVLANTFIVYEIEVNRKTNDGLSSGWFIARRYSEFHELFNILSAKYPGVKEFDFPKKSLNRLKSVGAVRSPQLERFLRYLLANRDVCRSRELRAFLSQNQAFPRNNKRKKSNLESMLNVTDPREGLAKMFLYLSESLDDASATSDAAASLVQDLACSDSGESIHKPVHEDGNDSHLSAFSKPIVDLLLEAFDLRGKKDWMKKRAIVLILQQILGGTIERRVRDSVSNAMSDSSLTQTLVQIREGLLLKACQADTQQSQIPTKSEKIRLTKNAQDAVIRASPAYLPDSAAKKIHRVLQIKILNVHLAYRILDELVDSIF